MKKPPLFIKKHKLLSIIAVLIVILFAWWTIANLTPKPLGDKLEYLGKEDYGCWIGFCDSRPYSVYYYGTDMTEEEVVEYFEKANLKSNQQETRTLSLMRFTLDNDEFYLSYYKNNETSFSTDKKAVISLPNFHYNLAKTTLN